MENKINYKLINITLVITIICLLYLIKGLWLGIVGKLFDIMLPFAIAFVVAYALYPLTLKLEKNGFPKWLAKLLVLILTFGFLVTIFILVIPML